MRHLTILVISAFVSTALLAQPPAFEVASVKPADPNSRLGLDLRVAPGGSLTITNLRLSDILTKAYDIKRYQMSGGPAWLDSDRFDINAKAAGNPAPPQVMAMLQTLLADRFQLKVHWETKEDNIYALVVAKGGPKLKPPTGDRPFIGLSRITPPELPGVSYAIGGKKASMALFAERLGDLGVHRPVIDRTGLTGEFDFRVEYAIDDNPETGPSLLTALPEQLGLKLEPIKGPVQILIIDKVERPSGN